MLKSLWLFIIDLKMFDFQIHSECPNTAGRVGSFSTPHGNLRTPQFMPVGTLGTVKGVTSDQLKKTGAEIILANTFHLHLPVSYTHLTLPTILRV